MGGTIYSDTRQHEGKHDVKESWWAAHGVDVVRRTLETGDYMADGSNVTVDTKRSIDEVAANIGGRGHDRFKRECVRARDTGLRLVVLIENIHGYGRVEDVARWTNTHCLRCRHSRRGCDPRDAKGKCMRHGTAKPIQGPRLMRAMRTMHERYGVQFAFCHPRDAARVVCERLGVGYDPDDA